MVIRLVVPVVFALVFFGCATDTWSREPEPEIDVAGTAGSDSENCSGSTEPRIPLESQTWWWRRLPSQTGTDFGHVHVFTCFPSRQRVSGIVELDLKVVFHKNPGVLQRLHIQGWPDTDVDNSGTGCEYITGNLWCADDLSLICKTDDCVWWFKAQIDTGRFLSDGLKEFRIRATAATPDGLSMSNSTSWFMDVQNEKGNETNSSYHDGRVLASRGWYDCHGYTVAEIHVDGTPPNPVPPSWKVRVVAKPGAKEKCDHVDEVAHHLLTIDPDFHADDPGLVIREAGGEFDGTVAIDTTQLSNGWHKLVLRADADTEADSTNSAVQVVWFKVQNILADTAYPQPR
ncbi:MAG TPA: hypothetical protein VF177_19555 [Anaerolineae bacterium]